MSSRTANVQDSQLSGCEKPGCKWEQTKANAGSKSPTEDWQKAAPRRWFNGLTPDACHTCPAPRAIPAQSLVLIKVSLSPPQAHQLTPLHLHEVPGTPRSTTVTTGGCISTERMMSPHTTSSFGQSSRASQPGLYNGKPLGKNLFVSEMELNTLVEVTACHKSPSVAMRFH